MARATDQQRAAARALYEAGELTNVEIAARVGVSDTAVRKWAAAFDWDRGKLFREADETSRERVADTHLKAHVARNEVRRTSLAADNELLDRAIVEIGANVLTEVRLRQHEDVRRARNLVSSLLGEAERLSAHNDLFEMVGEMLFNPDKYGRDKLNELYQAVIQHPGRVKVMKDLADALGTMITLERGVFGLPAIEPPPPSRLKPPSGVLDTPQDTYRWLAGQRGALLNEQAEDAREVPNAAAN